MVSKFMTQAPKKKRLLPKDIVERDDNDIAERVFGKRVKQELDREIEKADSRGIPSFMKEA